MGFAWFEDKAKVCGEQRAESGHTAQHTTHQENVFTLTICSPWVPGAISCFFIIIQHLQWEADREDRVLTQSWGHGGKQAGD